MYRNLAGKRYLDANGRRGSVVCHWDIVLGRRRQNSSAPGDDVLLNEDRLVCEELDGLHDGSRHTSLGEANA